MDDRNPYVVSKIFAKLFYRLNKPLNQLMRSFSIIIVTWNGLHHLKNFLPSVVSTNYPNFEIIIADNASADGSAEWIVHNYPNCKIVSLDKNYGYAGGNNKSVELAAGEVIIFLNNDAKPEPDWLLKLNECMNDTHADILQPKIKSLTQPDDFEYAGAAGGYIDWLGYPFCRGRLFDHIEKDEGQYDQTDKIFWASGAALTIKKELFIDLGGFDENFQFHMEEIDLCWRALRRGKSIYHCPKSVVYHLGAGSLSESSPRKTFYNYRNSLLMLTKNIEKYLFPKILLRLFLDGLSGIRFLLNGLPQHTLAIVKSHFSFYALLKDALNSRKNLRKVHSSTVSEYLIYQKLILIDYFIKKKKTFRELDTQHKSENTNSLKKPVD